ncbi:MAG: SDR family oxidoreductase [Acidimicrobiia bacterium]|nr:SDR family oxidoreductase [Acidimicrobiia bacterium]
MTGTDGIGVDLTDRVALVTGASRGLGAATAVRLARMGADVVVTYKKQAEAAEEVAAAVRAAGRRAWVWQVDMADSASIDTAFDEFAAHGGPGPHRLDILVANAAATSLKPLMEQKPHNIDITFAITVTGFIRSVQRAVPLMERGGGGRVVAISGIDTVRWAPAHGLLGAAKAAMEQLVRYFSVELADRNITLVGVNFDAFFGDGLKIMLGPYYDYLMQVMSRLPPLLRALEPEDAAEVVALCCTDAARLLCGNTLMADGGNTFAQSGNLTALLGALPEDVVRDVLGLDTDGGESGPDRGTSAPSVPEL